jgi:dihydroneopterin aldolase
MRQPGLADAGRRIRQVFLRDMVLQASIGVYQHEHTTSQRVRINVDLAVDEGDPADATDSLHRVVSYEVVANTVRRIAGAGHVKLVETLAERIAEACLADHRVLLARVQVEKLDIFPDAVAGGVVIERARR